MKALLLHAADDVAVASAKISKGETIELGSGSVKAICDVPVLHKIAIRDIPSGEHVHKYGYSIGISLGIKAGEHVHSHNLRTNLADSDDYVYSPKTESEFTYLNKSFNGYLRLDGRVGIRNQILIIPMVGCINSVCEQIAISAKNVTGFKDIFALPHPYGCSQLGDDLSYTQDILAGLASNPNNGGVLIVSLGCENNRLEDMLKKLNIFDNTRLMTLCSQDFGDEVEKGVELVSKLADACKQDIKSTCYLSDLKIGLKCGGSDAFSGITANPVVGAFADKVIAAGGCAIMTEIPEMFGAEQLLLDRCRTESEFEKLAEMIQDFKQYFISYGESVGENPSPGNKDGGITTLEEKSLGCVQKGGHAKVCEVLRYGQGANTGGLTVLEAPGNDATALTALTAAGAQLVLFTTGRGTPLGGIVPTLKISTNQELFGAKRHWLDFDGGEALNCGIERVAEKLMDAVLSVAGGEVVAAERNSSREIAIWKRGVTL